MTVVLRLSEKSFASKSRNVLLIQAEKTKRQKLFREIRLILQILSKELGYTYGGLGRHVLAYYFLVQVMGIEFVPLRSEIITNLIRLQDFRAPYLVENELHTLESGQSFADSGEEWRARYRRFLVERKTYLLMECGQHEAAEDFLHSLLSDAALKDFATKELLHLQELKNR